MRYLGKELGLRQRTKKSKGGGHREGIPLLLPSDTSQLQARQCSQPRLSPHREGLHHLQDTEQWEVVYSENQRRVSSNRESPQMQIWVSASVHSTNHRSVWYSTFTDFFCPLSPKHHGVRIYMVFAVLVLNHRMIQNI